MARNRFGIVMGLLLFGLGNSACGDRAPLDPVGAAEGEESSSGSSNAPVEGAPRTNLGAHRPEYLAPLLSNLNQCTMASYLEDDETGTWGWKKESTDLEPDAVAGSGAGAGEVSKVWYLRFDPESERKVIFEAQCIVPAALGAARRAAVQLNRIGPRTGRRSGGGGSFFADWGDPEVSCTWYSNWDIVECEGGSECVRAYFAPPVGPGAPGLPSGNTTRIEKDGQGGVYGTWECDPPPCTLYVSLISQDYTCEGEEEGEGEGCVEFEEGECGGGGGGTGDPPPPEEEEYAVSIVCTPTGVTRGSDVDCHIEGDGFSIDTVTNLSLSWIFTPDSVEVIPDESKRAMGSPVQKSGGLDWAGTMVLGGRISIEIDTPDALLGLTDTVTVAVTPRTGWSTSVTRQDKLATEGVMSTLASATGHTGGFVAGANVVARFNQAGDLDPPANNYGVGTPAVSPSAPIADGPNTGYVWYEQTPYLIARVILINEAIAPTGPAKFGWLSATPNVNSYQALDSIHAFYAAHPLTQPPNPFTSTQNGNRLYQGAKAHEDAHQAAFKTSSSSKCGNINLIMERAAGSLAEVDQARIDAEAAATNSMQHYGNHFFVKGIFESAPLITGLTYVNPGDNLVFQWSWQHDNQTDPKNDAC